MRKLYSFLIIFLTVFSFAPSVYGQFVGITGTGSGINYTSYGTITANLDVVRPFGTGTPTVTVYQDIFVTGFNGSVNLTSATLYYKVNSATVSTINDGTWTTIAGTLSDVGTNDRGTFSWTGTAGTDYMFYIRYVYSGTDYYGFNGTTSPHTALPSTQNDLYKIRFNKSASYNTQLVDGNTFEWQSTTQVCNRSSNTIGRTLDISWDATYIYFLVNGGFSASGGDRVHFGFDINPGTGANAGGTKSNYNGATFPENYRPDRIYRAVGTGSGTWSNDRAVFDGANGWTNTFTIANGAEVTSGSGGNNTNNLEFRVQRSSLGAFTNLGLYVWFGNSSNNLYDSYPHGNPTANGVMPIQIGLPDLNDNTTPSTASYFDGQYETNSFGLFGITNYRNLRITNPTAGSPVTSGVLTTLTGNLQIDASAGFTVGTNNVTVAGNVTSASNFTLTSTNFTVTGTTTLNSGSNFTDGDDNGTDIFVGSVSILGGTWSSNLVTTGGRLVFRGGLTSSGTSCSLGGATFNTNDQTIQGSTDITVTHNIAVDASRTLTVYSSGTNGLTLNATTTSSLNGGGTSGFNLILGFGGKITNSSTNATTTTIANLTVQGNANYVHNRNGGSILNGTVSSSWNASSTVTVNNISSTAPLVLTKISGV